MSLYVTTGTFDFYQHFLFEVDVKVAREKFVIGTRCYDVLVAARKANIKHILSYRKHWEKTVFATALSNPKYYVLSVVSIFFILYLK